MCLLIEKFLLVELIQDAPDDDGVVFIKNSGDLDLVDKFVLCRITDILIAMILLLRLKNNYNFWRIKWMRISFRRNEIIEVTRNHKNC